MRLVAAQLAMETGGCLPWSVTDYSPPDLAPLFDGRLFARYIPAGPSDLGTMTATGHIIKTPVTPAPPLIVLGFLAQNGLIGANQTDTLTRVLNWERLNLRHVFGGTPDPPLGAGVVYFGYNGRPPVSRMINGTSMTAPLILSGGGTYFDQEIRHWVGGCSGAVCFSAEVLRAVNIPAHRSAYAHFQNRFAVGRNRHVATAHGDDPYALFRAPEIPTGEILLSDATFHEWFVNEDDPEVRQSNVSRRTAELHLEYLPMVLVRRHCMDLSMGNTHANSFVYSYAFSGAYTVSELEKLGLWTSLDAKLESLGGCDAVPPP